ncbi:MAG: NAD(P)-dependent oxidoreductase, partial [Treponema sp.]|nr:NAD(P)-dependent oxidoreductase [Treponema sp.]
MKKILVTGGTGFIGRNVLPLLRRSYDVIAPARNELDIVDRQSVDAYLKNKRFDVLFHLAAPNALRNQNDIPEERFNYIVRAFLHFERHAKEFEKLIYLGSGAEYNKALDIVMAKETDVGKTIPEDPYGYAKYILNTITRHSDNIYNLRIFGCYGPADPPGKFIRDAIDRCLRGKAITIRQDCRFDYMYVTDLAAILSWFIENTPRYHDYNTVTGKPVTLLEIAEMVAEKMSNKLSIQIVKEGWNKVYTADNTRLLSELEDFQFTTLGNGIDRQIAWQ